MRRCAVQLQPWGWQYVRGSNERVIVPSRDQWWGREAGGDEAHTLFIGEQVDLAELREQRAPDLARMMEMRMAHEFEEDLREGRCAVPEGFTSLTEAGMTPEQMRLVLQAGFATSLVHVESRVASSFGLGFYTIGPGGEELAACIGAVLGPEDAMALHYRHTAAQVARQLQAGKPLAEVLLDRARGHVVSSKDPVTGGHHCAIGGGPYDFLVSSTLASQYLAAINIAEYAQHRNFKCPLVFTVSDNGIAISLKGYDWLQKEYVKKLRMKSFEADGRDMGAVFSQTKAAALYSRTTGRPSFLLYKNLPRRFGHAATDRQTAYLSPDEINGAAVENPLAYAAAQAVQAGAVTYAELHEMYTTTWAECRKAFDEAVNEPKVTERSVVQATTSQPLWEPEEPRARLARLPPNEANGDHAPKDLHVMRKHMTRVFDEILAEQSDVVYVGEDVEHGGYYLVTDGLAKKYPHRVKDFPPEESALMGLGIGYAQIGFVPVVEIPYAKYLDCGVDQFFEAGLMNWLSHGRQPCGMVIRLQGFDRGVFGGNFHTHNMLHLPPGIDVVCYSNGPEYARGMRHCVKQARAGRVVMSVDCTNLLNSKHLDPQDRDGLWEMPYTKAGDIASFDEVTVYGPPDATTAVVTYGNGVITSIAAAREMEEKYGIDVKVIDCPYLSGIPEGLLEAMQGVDAVVFADICKFGQHPFGAHIGSLKFRDLLPDRWQVCAAQPTYNPLGTYLTFLNVPDVTHAIKHVLGIEKFMTSAEMPSMIQ